MFNLNYFNERDQCLIKRKHVLKTKVVRVTFLLIKSDEKEKCNDQSLTARHLSKQCFIMLSKLANFSSQ